jgi:DNA polymerase I-like protein with 3'-5' exonuclease and polymerase domains
MTDQMPLAVAPDAVAVDYVVEGPRTTAAVAAGRTRLIGLILQEANQEPRFVDQDLAGLLASLGDRQRLYPNSLFALAVEAMNDLPPPAAFHDFHALCCLLYGHDPFQWQPSGSMDRAEMVEMSLARHIPFASYSQFLSNAALEKLDSVYEQIELPVIVPTLSMTLAGVPFNPDTLERLADREGPIRACAGALLRHVQPDGRIYADLDPLGAVTGRYSCRDPNLQGLPAAILAAVEASPGHLVMEADVSQCELRVLAHFSQDPRLLAAYRDRDVDLHVQTAAAALGIAEQQVTEEQRNRIGKQVNFAIVYGMTADGLAQKLAISPNEAQGLLDGYFATYSGVQRWLAQVQAVAHKDRQVSTLSGRRRRLPEIRSRDPGEVAAARRHAVNTIIQGSAADLLKLALIRLRDSLPDEVRMLLSVHDSVLLAVPEPLVEGTRQVVVEVMESTPVGFAVPLKVDIHTGATWADCK